jgi:hypothetical protein
LTFLSLVVDRVLHEFLSGGPVAKGIDDR